MTWAERLNNVQSALQGAPVAPQGVPPVVGRWLAKRGLSSIEEIEAELNPKLRDLTHPYKILDLERAAERLVVALEGRQAVAVYADFDLDGTAGLSLFCEGLRDFGFARIIPYQPLRLGEGYGLHAPALEKLSSQGADVFVSIDVGITAIEAADKALQLKKDLIITDHHQPKEKLPAAFAVVNPNRADDDSGLGHLCGAGVALYLLLGLKIKLQERGLLQKEFDYRKLLDFFVIATLTDMVPLKKENRILVKHGIMQMERTRRPGLRRLLDSLGMSGKKLSSQDIAIRFAPKLNALSRLEEIVRPFDLLSEADDSKAAQLVDTVLAANEKRVQLQNDAVAEARSLLQKDPPKSCVFVCSKNFHRGVVGLVATRLSQEFGLPAFVGAAEANGQTVGSSRLSDPKQISLLEALEFAQEHLVRFGGHDPAAGFELHANSADALKLKLEEFYLKNQIPTAASVVYDTEARLSEIDREFETWIDQLAPFGVGFEEPIFLFRSLVVSKVTDLRGGHVKLNLEDLQAKKKIDALWFSPPKDHDQSKNPPSEGEMLDVIGSLQWNEFRGSRTLQLVVKDLRLSSGM